VFINFGVEFEFQDLELQQRKHSYLEILNHESSWFVVILQEQLLPTTYVQWSK